MVTRTDLRELAALGAGPTPVVSFFINVDGRDRSPIRLAEATHLLVRDAREQADEKSMGRAAMEAVQQDLERIVRLVGTDLKPEAARGLAVFACSARGLWRVHTLPCPIDDVVKVEARPYIRPLATLLAECSRTGVVLVDREKARLFLVEFNAITEIESVRDDVPGRVRLESWYGLSDSKAERHVDEHIRQHVKHVASSVAEMVRRDKPVRLLLGGTPDVVPALQRALSHGISGLVAGRLEGLMIIASPEDVLDRAVVAIRKAVGTEAWETARSIMEIAAPAGHGASGMDATLHALYSQSVHTLVLDDGLTISGYRCALCGRLLPKRATCPECSGNTLEHVSDIGESAIEEALRQDARVEFVTSRSEQPQLEGWDGIGARLRFLAPAAAVARSPRMVRAAGL